MIPQATKDEAKHVDLLVLIGRDTRLRKVASTNGGEFAGPCPFCGGRDRLRVQPQRGLWWCRQCGGDRWQDAIAYVMKRDSVEFAEACARLTDRNLSSDFKPVAPATIPCSPATQGGASQGDVPHGTKATPDGPPSAAWQARAQKFITWCESALWDETGAPKCEYLHARGLTDETLKAWHIGYNPKPMKDAAQKWGLQDHKPVWLPQGIVIPCRVANVIWYVKIRNLEPTGEKYPQIKGSRPALFGADTLGAHDYAVLTEGEFDALVTWQALQHASDEQVRKIGIATLGSASKDLDIDMWARFLLPIARLLICYDTDADGQRGAEKWLRMTQRARRVIVPKINAGDKDLNDYHLAGGRILDLITFEIARDRWQRAQSASSAPAESLTDSNNGMHESDEARAAGAGAVQLWRRSALGHDSIRNDVCALLCESRSIRGASVTNNEHLPLGVLVFDDSECDLAAKVGRAAHQYVRCRGRLPSIVYLHPRMAAADEGNEIQVRIGCTQQVITLCRVRSMMPQMMWIGDDHSTEGATT